MSNRVGGREGAASLGRDRRGRDEVFAGSGPIPELLRQIDWSLSPLGPVEQWSAGLVGALRLILPSPSPLMIWWGPELIQVYNGAYAELMGTKHPAATGQPAAECWAEVWSELAPRAEAVLLDGTASHLEGQLLLLDRHGYREETYWTLSFSPIRDAGGAVQGVLVASVDATARIVGSRRLETVRQLGALSAAVIGSLEDTCRAAVGVLGTNRQAVPFAGIYLVDPAGRTAELVASYGLSVGTPPLPAKRILLSEHELLNRAVSSGTQGLLAGLRESMAPEACEPSPLGDEVPDAAVVIPVSSGGAGSASAIAVLGVNPYRAIDDVYLTFFQLVARQLRGTLADAVAYEAERERANALFELSEDKNRFYQNVSHELRTPLTMILAPLAEILQRTPPLEPRDRTALDQAHRAALRLRKLVDTMLDLSQIEANATHAELQPTDLGTLTVELVGMFESLAAQAGLTLGVDVSAYTGPTDADAEMWAKIVLNLLSNAIKFTETGGVTVDLRETGPEVQLRVSDTGIGIAPEQSELVFQRFAQLPGQQGRSTEGYGIGLALVAALAAAHGGSASVDSEPGNGSTFVVTLPSTCSGADHEARHASTHAALPYMSEAGSWVASQPDTAPGDPAASVTGRLLLVEDNSDLREYLSRVLREDGWEVVAVGDVERALRVEPPPEIVVSDVMLPGRSGIELVGALRADPELNGLPVILLTAWAGPEATAEGLNAGADDYITKPFDVRELLARVRVHHELARLRDYALSKAQDQTANLRQALASNREIGMAMGVIMARERLTQDQAFDLLRSASQHSNRKLRDVAAEVVLTGALPEPHELA